MATELNLYQKVHLYVLPLCRPTAPGIISSPRFGKQTLVNLINFYGLSASLLATILSFAFNTFFNISLFLMFFAMTIIMMASLLLTCRTNPSIYKFTNSIILILAGPAALALSESNLFYAMATSFVVPSLTLILFQERFLAYATLIIEYILFNLFYQPFYQKALRTPILKDLEMTTYQHFNSLNFVLVFNALALYLVFSMNQSSHSLESSSRPSFNNQTQVMAKFAARTESLLNHVVNNLNAAQLEESHPKSKVFVSKAKVFGDVLLCQTRNILDLQQIETRSFSVDSIPTKVSDLLEKIWLISSEIILRKGLFGTLTVHKKTPSVIMIDQQRLMQIIITLISNAVRFTEKGDISISVNWIEKETIEDSMFEPNPFDEGGEISEGGGIGEAKTNTLIRPGCRGKIDGVYDVTQKKISDSASVNLRQIVPKKGILKVIITDTGCGMKEEEAQAIQNKNSQQGKGFTVRVVNQLCQNLNGKARLYSKSGKGAIWIICLQSEIPNPDLLEGNPNFAVVEERPSQRKIKGILIDDNPFTSDTIKLLLEKSQVDVINVVKNKDDAADTYGRELRLGRTVQIIAIVINAQTSLEKIKTIYEKIRSFENNDNIEPSAILFLSESYGESQLKTAISTGEPVKATFYLRLPVYFPELQRLVSSVNNVEGAVDLRENFHPKKVLVVNDNTFNLDLLCRMLAMHGYEHLQAMNGEQAVEVYKNNWRDIAVVFMDVEMPIMDGFEATREIRKYQQSSRIPKIRILGVSGHSGHQHDERCRNAGMDGSVTVPFSTDQVKKTVAESLYQYQ